MVNEGGTGEVERGEVESGGLVLRSGRLVDLQTSS